MQTGVPGDVAWHLNKTDDASAAVIQLEKSVNSDNK